MAKRRYSPKVKFQVVLEALTGEKTPGQIAKQYGIHPNSVGLWKKEFLERGAEPFAEGGTVQEYERRIHQLEQLVGKVEATALQPHRHPAHRRFRRLHDRDLLRQPLGEETPPGAGPRSRPEGPR